MKTKRAPWDYQRPVIIVSQKIKLCQLCGGHVFYMPNEVYRCIDCRTVGKFDEIEEADAAFYRDCLAKKQEDDAVLLALSMLPQMAFVQDAVNMVADITPETETEMNSWIEENDAWLQSAPVAVQQAAVYMEADPRTAEQRDEIPNTAFGSRAWFAGIEEETL